MTNHNSHSINELVNTYVILGKHEKLAEWSERQIEARDRLEELLKRAELEGRIDERIRADRTGVNPGRLQNLKAQLESMGK